MHTQTNGPVVLVVLDGWGYSEDNHHNAILEAHTPFWDKAWAMYPHAFLSASGASVGLPDGQIGSSEIGHMIIGLGKILDNDLVRINKAVLNGSFNSNQAFQDLCNHVRKHNSVLHVLGLVSPGGIHSHQEHIHEFIRVARMQGVAKVAIHIFTDGRDTPPQSASEYIRNLEAELVHFPGAAIATVSGRYFAMDRDNNWDRIDKAEQAIFGGLGQQVSGQLASQAVADLYMQGQSDEFLEPLVFVSNSGQSQTIVKNDGVFFFNIRADRARQLCQRIAQKSRQMNLHFTTMTEYDSNLAAQVAFPPEPITTTLAGEIAAAGFRQVHIAETEKYAHATYFLNGGREQPYEGETHVLVESRKDVATHDQAPGMKAKEITDKAALALEQGVEFLFINYANADMVGHTANFDATKQAIEAIDAELARLVQAVQGKGGVVVITADHGNAEQGRDAVNGNNHTAHTTNPVPFIITKSELHLQNGGTLADVAPTVLTLLGLPIPSAMTGKVLIM